jgi:SPP1 gp7 family putative phage head morphogenesis protein
MCESGCKLVTNAAQKTIEPGKVDPSRTFTLRKKLVSEFGRRFRLLASKVFDLVYKEDVFGLKEKRRDRLTFNERWKFNTTSEQVKLFEEWLKKEVSLDILPLEKAVLEEAYWYAYIEEGYRKGAGRAFTELKKPIIDFSKQGSVSDFYLGTRQEFLASAFAHPETIDKVKLLAGRVFTDLKNVTESMSADMQRVLTGGLTRGDGALTIARELNNSINSIGKRRAETIARTEIMRAHNEGALDTYENFGITEFKILAEWSTAGDLRVCPQCVPLEGTVFTMQEIRGLLPRHPNCRCVPLPANVGEDPSKQIRSRTKINEAIDESIRKERSKQLSLETKRKLSKWQGADLKITKSRPKSIF